MRQETEQSIAMAMVNGEKYDESCKDVFKNREIIAPILKYVVAEFKDCTQEEIIRCIDADSITEDIPVEEIPAEVKELGTEMSAVFEKAITYDIHFKAKNPKLSNEKIKIMLHMDFEIQNDYRPRNPAYPIIMRSIYYVAREISSQLGKITGKTNYADLEKVYSIWICNENIPKELQNTVTRYSFTKEDIIGITNEPEEHFDLMEVIIIRRGHEQSEEDIFRYLESIFESDLAKIKEYVDIPVGSDIEKEVTRMTGLGESLYNKAYHKAYSEAYSEAYNEAYNKAYNEVCNETVIKMVKMFYKRNNDEEMAIMNLQEGLNVSYEQAKELFEKEIAHMA